MLRRWRLGSVDAGKATFLYPFSSGEEVSLRLHNVNDTCTQRNHFGVFASLMIQNRHPSEDGIEFDGNSSYTVSVTLRRRSKFTERLAPLYLIVLSLT